MSEIEITPEAIDDYCEKHSTPPSATQLDLIRVTHAELPQAARMQVGHLEGRFLSLMAKLTQAKTALEFGTFTGYSALSLAEGVSEKVVTLDRDPKTSEIAQRFWNQSEHGKKIELILGDAHETVQQLSQDVRSKKRPQFDIAFIDADKAGYQNYWNSCLSLVRKGGLILVDNVLWSGQVLNPQEKSDHEIHAFNEMAIQDTRVECLMLPLRDGVLMARVK